MHNRNMKFAIKGLVFIALTIGIVIGINNLVKPEYYYVDENSETTTFEGFYELERDTVDVIFLGSSHATYSFNPQVIYDKYGITSYNLGSPEQSVLVSYYWLKEALKYQSPKVVILDTYTFHRYMGNYDNKLNCSEGAIRAAMDYMRPSRVKYEAAQSIEANDPTQRWESFFLYNIRYHSRWKGLNENDFSKREMINHGDIRGYTINGYTPEGEHDIVFNMADAEQVDAEPMVGIATEYLDKITDLCRQNNINLVFTCIPMEEPIARYKATKQYADEHGIPFYDFNEVELYHAVDYSKERDNYSHPNYSGAEKISTYLGGICKAVYNIAPREDDSFEKSRLVYNHKLNNIALMNENNIYSYLDLIKDGYTVLLFIPIDSGEYLDYEMLIKLQKMGLFADIRNCIDGKSYCAVKDGASIYEELTDENISYTGSLRNVEQYSFYIDKTAVDSGWHTYSLKIAGEECGNRLPGINVVVYDNDMRKVIDKINVDTTVPELTVSHY